MEGETMTQKKQLRRQKNAPTEMKWQRTVTPSREEHRKKLEIVLKCDFVGSKEALVSALATIDIPAVEIRVIHAGVGPVSKSDLIMAMTGSRLVTGFNVDIMPGAGDLAKEYGVEVRLYNVIYRLMDDVKQIARNLVPAEPEERITGKAEVIELFKSSRKGVILGCEVKEGSLVTGKNFRIIAAMGPIYTGKIESLHIEQNAVKEAGAGQQVGLKLSEFNKAKVGDLIECFQTVRPQSHAAWTPKTGVYRFYS